MPLLVFSVMMGVFSLTRLALLLQIGSAAVPPLLWPMLFLKGLWFDTLVSGVCISPLLLARAALPARGPSAAWYQRLGWFSLWLFLAALLFAAAAEFTFWLEFTTRFNFITVDYLIYTHEVFGNIYESYPIVWILVLVALAAAGIAWLLRPFLRAAAQRPLSKGARLRWAGLGLLAPALAFALGNADQMKGSGNAYAEELSGNGFYTLAAALRQNDLDYDRFYPTMPQEEADEVLKGLKVERSPLSALLKADMFDDAADPLPFKRRPKNVVLITIESLSASFVGAYGSDRGLTPNIDRMALGGMMFKRFYATGTRTARGLEALSLGTPPIPGQSIVRRPHNEHLSTIGEVLQRQGFATLFIYGGYGYFDNMNAYFSANDYRIVDRRDFKEDSIVFENIWGVADESLFVNAMEAINGSGGKPFFAHIMTTSNHRPFTYPDGRIDIPSPGGRFGAVKYTDYAVGRFMAEAEKRPWFKDTLFVITADHCGSAGGKSKLPVNRYFIPLILYGPAIVKPGAYDAIASQIDLMPSLVEALGMKGDDHFFGRSFFEDFPNPNRAFVSNFQELGYLRNDLLTVLLPRRQVEYYRVNPQTGEQTPASPNPEFLREAIAYYQTAARAFKTGNLKIPEESKP